MALIEASILASDYARLGEQAREAAAAGVDGIQIDVMDGRYVPSITFGPGVVRALRPLVSVTLDVDLMIVEPEKHIEAFAEAGADRLIVHWESCAEPLRVLMSVRKLGVEVGVAIRPGTSPEVLEDALGLVDIVQVMTVTPGAGGRALIPGQLDVVRQLRQSLDDKGLDVSIGVDGGIYLDTAPLAAEAGASMLVCGSAIFNSQATVAENVAALRAGLGRGRRPAVTRPRRPGPR
ncbi:MAG: ribulose-phosphate 3-epimerase [Anaerolineales bacterium]|nr:MAG: ribulose-phosphate 3-epimerase [Anaerolineales bacterium]